MCVTVHDLADECSGIVTFTVAGTTAASVAASLRSIGVNTAAPQARTSRLDLDRTGVEAVIRASPHYYNTESELDRLADGVADLVGVSRGSR